MTQWSRTLALLLALSLASAPLPAFAQEAEYSEQTIAEVNEHFSNGAKLYYDGAYDDAIVEFEAAHAKIPNAIFLYNISLALSKKGERERALEVARQADDFGGLGPDEAVQNRARIVALERSVQAEQTAVDVDSRIEPLVDFSVYGWAGTGLVVLAAIGYGSVGVTDRNLAQDVEAHEAAVAGGNTAAADRLADDIRPRQTQGKVVFTLSTIALVGGASLLVYDLFFRKGEAFSLQLAPMGSQPGLVLHGQFR